MSIKRMQNLLILLVCLLILFYYIMKNFLFWRDYQWFAVVLHQKTKSKNSRAIPIEMIDERISYDMRGRELLTVACNSVTEPSGLRLTSPLTPVSSLQPYPVMRSDE